MTSPAQTAPAAPRLADRIADRSAATLIAALFVATLFGNAALWAGRIAGM